MYAIEYWSACGLTDHALCGVAAAAIAGDPLAQQAVWDHAAEHWSAEMIPFEVGKEYLIETQTLYYVGRVREIVGGFLILDRASWVHWTGRKGTLLRLRRFKGEGWKQGEARPRTEYVGDGQIVALGGIIAAAGPPWELPGESIQ